MFDDDNDFEIKTRARENIIIANTINVLREQYNERKIWVVRERVAKTFLLLNYYSE